MSRNKDLAKRMMDVSWYSESEKKLLVLSFICQFGFLILTIFVPFKMGTAWFYVGVILFAIGFITNIIATHNYATTPNDQAITKGMYKISRHPLYLCYSISTLGLVVATASIPLFIIWAIHNTLTHFLILAEERYCLKTYPESYKEYMQKVPRYILFF